jgi:sulfur-carrier protein
MPIVRVHGPLKQLAGGRSQHELDAVNVIELIRSLEREHPQLSGWIVDERGHIRRHINVFVNGERGAEHTPVAACDRVEVLPAITGG